MNPIGSKYRKATSSTTERMCTKCLVWKSYDQFFALRSGVHGKMSQCKDCRRKYDAQRKFRLRTQHKDSMQTIKMKITNALRCRISHALTGITKASSTQQLLGCTFVEFRQYMEQRFKPGVSWSNYGLHGWHIGHLKDCCAFDLTDEEQQRQCFHYTNMEPQWASANWSKPRMGSAK